MVLETLGYYCSHLSLSPTMCCWALGCLSPDSASWVTRAPSHAVTLCLGSGRISLRLELSSENSNVDNKHQRWTMSLGVVHLRNRQWKTMKKCYFPLFGYEEQRLVWHFTFLFSNPLSIQDCRWKSLSWSGWIFLPTFRSLFHLWECNISYYIKANLPMHIHRKPHWDKHWTLFPECLCWFPFLSWLSFYLKCHFSSHRLIHQRGCQFSKHTLLFIRTTMRHYEKWRMNEHLSKCIFPTKRGMFTVTYVYACVCVCLCRTG